MVKRLIIFFILVTKFLPASFCQQNNIVTIKAYLHGKQGIPLNYLDRHSIEHGILLKNTTDHDTVITAIVNIDNQVEFQKRAYSNNRGVKQSFLAKGGDVISLRIAGEHMTEVDGKNIFPQDYLKYADPFTRTIRKLFNTYTDKELSDYYLECEQIYRYNLLKIDSLDKSGHLSVPDKDFFVKFNDIDHRSRRLQPLGYGSEFFPQVINKFISGNEIADTRNFLKTFNTYNTIDLNGILYPMISYDLYQQKIAPDDLLGATEFVVWQWYGDKGRNFILHRIANYPVKNSPLVEQSLTLLAKNTYPEQLPAINVALLLFRNSSKNIDNPETIKLTTVNGTETNLGEVLKKYKGNMILLDLWASWCVPCRQEIPIVQRLKEKYKDRKISFVSMSLDADKAKSQWLAAVKRDGNFNDTDQYRFIGKHSSSFTKFYNVTSIPRYMLLDSDGKMITADFMHAAEPGFESALTGYLEKVK
ncbi:MAG: TlpA family protein disulfide reductase [Mucilaginibacter sp.]|nr:TlpA family protein disulfide reductase [Mucilaginibacter sp.]